MRIRPETSEDIQAIEALTSAAFRGKTYSDETEHIIINRLRNVGALALSLVAEMDGKIVGHVAFSKVTINGDERDWYALGPISVRPDLQKQGIGSKLMHAGLAEIRAMGARGCVLLGDPNYYHRFGFKADPTLIYAGSPAPEYFMALPLYDADAIPNGKVEFHKAFYDSE